MHYAVSDIHGCYDKYIKLLERIAFTDDDTLYILGDIVDRGEKGIEILTDAAKRKNVVPLKGNHDYLAHRLLKEMCNYSGGEIPKKQAELLNMWISDGGMTTLNGFRRLPREKQSFILSYLGSFSIYEELTINDNLFFMAHTVPDKERMQNFNQLIWHEFIVGEPEYDKTYFSDRIIVTGHTPTRLIDKSYRDRIFVKNNHIALDCGAVFGGPLGCICLDTFEEFYIQ